MQMNTSEAHENKTHYMRNPDFSKPFNQLFANIVFLKEWNFMKRKWAERNFRRDPIAHSEAIQPT